MTALLNEASGIIGDVSTGETVMTVSERLLTGIKYFAIGLLTVFIVLFLIIIVIKLVSILIDKVKIKKKDKSASKVNAEDKIEYIEVDDSEEIAAVMAAITAYMSTVAVSAKPVGFKVRSIKTIINK